MERFAAQLQAVVEGHQTSIHDKFTIMCMSAESRMQVTKLIAHI